MEKRFLKKVKQIKNKTLHIFISLIALYLLIFLIKKSFKSDF